jgi:hypothetical protein
MRTTSMPCEEGEMGSWMDVSTAGAGWIRRTPGMMTGMGMDCVWQKVTLRYP